MPAAAQFLRLFETVTPELSYLLSYLTLSDEDINRDALYSKGVEDWPDSRGNWVDELPPEVVAKLDAAAGREEGDGDDDLWFGDKDWDGFVTVADTIPEFAKDYAADIARRLQGGGLGQEDPAELPSYTFFSDAKLLRNVWLVHFTSDSYGIARKGFTFGVDDMTRLGLTTYFKNDGYSKKYGGYNFAYTADDVDRYSSDRYGTGTKYGNEAVMFKASCVRAWHSGDEEPQAIFWGPAVSPKDIIPIDKGQNREWAIAAGHHNSGEGLVEFDEIGALADWAEMNWAQYHRLLSRR